MRPIVAGALENAPAPKSSVARAADVVRPARSRYSWEIAAGTRRADRAKRIIITFGIMMKFQVAISLKILLVSKVGLIRTYMLVPIRSVR